MKKEKIINKIKDLIQKATDSKKEILVEEEEKLDPKNKQTRIKNLWFKVFVEDARPYIHHEGEAVWALNHLARRVVESEFSTNSSENDLEPMFDVLVDINDFQKKRIETIHATVHMMAERARYFKSNIEIDPMSAFERRIVHEFLADATDLETESSGVGRDRRVIIKYIGGDI